MNEIMQTPGDTQWFQRDRLGLFIHWGLYSSAARQEWVKQIEEIGDEEYDRYFRHFDPDLYDPDQWAQVAAEAGVKYFVITTKHHDGFCLWDSRLTDYKAPKTPIGRDLLRPMVEAFRQRDIRVGFYHSLIDWHHPSFVIDGLHSLRNHPQRREMNQSRNQQAYIDYLHGQVRELLTEFGRIDMLWFDYSYPTGNPGYDMEGFVGKGRDDWDSERLYAMVRELQPHIILNDRLDLEQEWDVRTAEEFSPQQGLTVAGRPVCWEACMTLSGHWGYHRDDAHWLTVDDIIGKLGDTVGKGGNLLINVGPTGRGEIDAKHTTLLRGVGKWMQRHQRAIYGCGAAPKEFTAPNQAQLTYNPATQRLYVHLLAWPFRELHFDHMADKVDYAQFLHDASEIKANQLTPYRTAAESVADNVLTLTLPIEKPDVAVPVIELFLK